MKKLFLVTAFFFVCANTKSFSQSIGFSYKSTMDEEMISIRTMNYHNSYSMFFLYKYLIVDVGLESLNFYENAHVTDGLNWGVDRTFYGYVAEGNLNSLTYLNLSLGVSFQTLKYFRFSSGASLGLAVKKSVENKFRDKDGNYLFSFNMNGKDGVSDGRLKFFQSITFEKAIYKGAKLFVGYESSISVSSINNGKYPNYYMPNAEMYDLWSSYLSFGLIYDFSSK